MVTVWFMKSTARQSVHSLSHWVDIIGLGTIDGSGMTPFAVKSNFQPQIESLELSCVIVIRVYSCNDLIQLEENIMLVRSRACLLAISITLLCTPAFGAWTKSIEKDPFDDKVFNLWFSANRLSGALEFVFGCDNEGKFSLYWQYARQGQTGVMAMDMGVIIRLDSDAATEEDWNWNPSQATIRPKDASAFMKKILTKKKLAIKSSLGGDMGIFDISGAGKAYQEAQKTCKLR